MIDFQVEYQVVNPLVIYEASGYKEGEDVSLSYINNIIHYRLSELIQKNPHDISYGQLLTYANKIVQELHTEKISQEEEKRYHFLKHGKETINLKDYISINEIIITSFDKNISLRTTI